jgi:threonyl-tRNA synthetase
VRILIWHCDSFRSEVAEKGRSPLRVEVPNPTIDVGECLLVYSACEKRDEVDPSAVVNLAVKEVVNLARQLKVGTVVLHSFAHLFVELSSPQTALDMLAGVEERLREEKLTVFQTPFGWFNRLAIKTKGHPISRVAREIRLD